jgi:ectoine hydroxylase-related dioxygenase (phytanoyl-CoA dioxygenase family)
VNPSVDDLSLHELNGGFSWDPYRGPFRLISDEQAESYNERGYFLLEGAIPPEELAELIAEIDPVEAQMEDLLRAHGGKAFIARAGEITFTVHLVTRSPRLSRFVRSRVFRDLGHDLLGPDVRLYWGQAVYKKPGTEAPFPWHQDNGYTFIEPQQYLTCWIALTDATLESGCPWVVPGLHEQGTLAHRASEMGHVCLEGWPDEAVPVEARAGDIVVFSSLTPHATGPNRSSQVRKAYIVQFAPDGAEVVTRADDGTLVRTPAAAEERQFPILQAGEPVPKS